jgi:hypothetical protein
VLPVAGVGGYGVLSLPASGSDLSAQLCSVHELNCQPVSLRTIQGSEQTSRSTIQLRASAYHDVEMHQYRTSMQQRFLGWVRS